ncbi:MAG: quinoprotein relay system zinc metallohydrolase 2 [Roseibium sp.]
MFEIIVSLCLLSDPGICRPQLLAGLETPTEQGCIAARNSLDVASLVRAGEGTRIGVATCRQVPPGLELTEVAQGVYVHKGEVAEPDPANLGDISNAAVVIGDRSIAVIDAGGSRAVGEDLYRAVRTISALPISHLVLTHNHPDHVFGASVFAEAGAEIVGHPNLPRALSDRQEAYSRTFTDEIGQAGFLGSHAAFPITDMPEIDLGGRRLVLTAWPLAHSAADLTVRDDLTGILFTGDLVFDGHVPVLDGSLRGWQQALDGLEVQGADSIVPGHGGPLMSVDDGISPMRDYLLALEEDTRRELDAGERMSSAVSRIGQGQAPRWALFDRFNARNATVAFSELEWE